MEEIVKKFTEEDMWLTLFVEGEDPKKYFWKENGLAILLAEDILFCNEFYYSYDGKEIAGKTTMLFVNCNDVFVPGADSEILPLDEIENLFKLHLETPKHWGHILWVMERRKTKPWNSRTIQWMKNNNLWKDEYDRYS